MQKPDKNFSFFIGANLKRYAGQYVAIADGRVATSGKNFKKVYTDAKKKYPGTEILFWKEPEGDYFIFKFTF